MTQEVNRLTKRNSNARKILKQVENTLDLGEKNRKKQKNVKCLI